MIKLSTEFSEEERDVLLEYLGDNYEVLPSIEGDSYVLCEMGNYSYNQCFHPTKIEFFANQQYVKVMPYRIFKFYQYYLMNTKEEKNIWYRGRKDVDGNWEYDCFSDSLEEVLESL